MSILISLILTLFNGMLATFNVAVIDSLERKRDKILVAFLAILTFLSTILGFHYYKEILFVITEIWVELMFIGGLVSIIGVQYFISLFFPNFNDDQKFIVSIVLHLYTVCTIALLKLILN